MERVFSPANPLAELFRQAYGDFLAQLDTRPSAPALHASLLEIANGLRMTSSQRRGIELAQADAVKYAFCAIVDEVLLNTGWSGQPVWKDCLLEAAVFHTSMSGEHLFERITLSMKVRQLACVEIAAVYLDCLNLGFRGKYRSQADGQTTLAALRGELFFFVHQRQPELDAVTSLTSETDDENVLQTEPHQRSQLEHARWHLYVLAIFAVPLLLSCLLWKNVESVLSPQLDEIAKVKSS